MGRGAAPLYLRQLGTDKFEQRVYLHLGNGTESRCSYEPERHRQHTLLTETAAKCKVMDNVNCYDAVSNILSQANNSLVPSLMGGPTTATYQYDDLYRLTQAQGLWTKSATSSN